MPPQRSTNVQAIVKGCKLLDLLSRGNKSYSIREIALALGLPKPTVHRILSTLFNLGLVSQDPHSKDYFLGFRLVELGQAVLDRIDFRKEAEPFLGHLANTVQETVHLAQLDDGKIVYLDKVEKINMPTGLRMASRIGARNYAHSSALGKVLLAFAPRRSRAEIFKQKGLPKLTENTITNLSRLQAHLERVRAEGYALDDEENEKGIRCVAAPIMNHAGEVIAAISISGPTVRMTMERINNELTKQVVAAAVSISQKLGYKVSNQSYRKKQ
jgi:IclR family KDG regulon transcriptional repressor